MAKENIYPNPLRSNLQVFRLLCNCCVSTPLQLDLGVMLCPQPANRTQQDFNSSDKLSSLLSYGLIPSVFQQQLPPAGCISVCLCR